MAGLGWLGLKPTSAWFGLVRLNRLKKYQNNQAKPSQAEISAWKNLGLVRLKAWFGLEKTKPRLRLGSAWFV